MLDWGVILPAVGIFIGVFLTAIVTYRAARVSELEKSYQKLQKTYEDVNARLNNELEAERIARRRDRMSCESQIADLQRQLTALLSKLPDPGHIQPVIIAGIDTATLPALPVEVIAPTPVPVELVRPIPLPMTAAEAKAAREEMEK